MDNKTYSIKDVASILSVSQKQVRRYVASGGLKTLNGRNPYVISEDDFNAFRESLENDSCLAQNPILTSFGDTGSPAVSSDPNWTSIASWWNTPPESSMTFVDLFCGAGGLSKGLEMAGLHGICGLDFFPEACLTYKRNFSHPFINGDITLESNKTLFYETVEKELAGRPLDIVAGGFPCQGFSSAGNRLVDDSRNTLYRELISIVTRLQPRFVICENVRGLRTMLDGAVERKIISDFAEIGYRMNVAVLNAADYYVPQKRERVIFIGNRTGDVNYHPSPLLEESSYVTVGQAIGDLMDMGVNPPFNHIPCVHNPEMAKKIMKVKEGESLYPNYKESYKKCPWDAPSCTIKENHGGTNLHPKLPRVITAREMARLQSFPDDFIFEGSKSKQLTQIGNAVPPLLGKAIGLAVRISAGELERHEDKDA